MTGALPDSGTGKCPDSARLAGVLQVAYES